jgi:hypothetical protein
LSTTRSYQPAGDAVRIENGSAAATLRNNVLWAQNGFGIAVRPESRNGFGSDYNVFFRGFFGTAPWASGWA